MDFQDLTKRCITAAGGVTQLAEDLNCNRGSIYKWLNGSVPKAETLKTVVNYANSHQMNVHIYNLIK